MPVEAVVSHGASAPGNAAEAVQQLTQHARSLVERVHQLLSSHQESSSRQAAISTGHIAIYDEAVEMLQAKATAAMQTSTEMQHACTQLYDKLAGVDAVAKQVKELRQSVERLEAQLNARLKCGSCA